MAELERQLTKSSRPLSMQYAAEQRRQAEKAEALQAQLAQHAKRTAALQRQMRQFAKQVTGLAEDSRRMAHAFAQRTKNRQPPRARTAGAATARAGESSCREKIQLSKPADRNVACPQRDFEDCKANSAEKAKKVVIVSLPRESTKTEG